MREAIPFSGARLEKDDKVVDQDLAGQLIVTRSEAQSSLSGSFTMQKMFYTEGMATLVAPGKFKALINLTQQINGVCHFSGADKPEFEAGVK